MEDFHIDVKKMVLSLLADDEVRDAIKGIFDAEREEPDGSDKYVLPEKGATEQPEEWMRKTEAEEILEDKEKELSGLKVQIMELEKEKTEKDEKLRLLQDDLDNAEEEKNRLRKRLEPVKEFLEVWEALSGLDDDPLDYLSGLAGSNDIYAFMTLGREFSKVKQLGKYVRDIAVVDATDENIIHILDRYFCFCINVYNSIYGHRKLSQIPVSIGEEYSSEKCTKTSSSSFNGRIEKVLVAGFKNNDVEFRPVVKTS